MNLIAIRQGAASFLFWLDVFLVAVIVMHLARERRELGWRFAATFVRNRAAVAVLILTVGHILERAWTIYLFHVLKSGRDPLVVEAAYPINLTGTIIAALGMTYCLRVFSREVWGERLWITAVCFSFIASLMLVSL